MSDVDFQVHANCLNWERLGMDYADYPEDCCGSCVRSGKILYGDDDACEHFVAKASGMQDKKHKSTNKEKQQRRAHREDWR